ncbi:DNA polymerase III subunit delta [Aliidiomarina sp. Khilg15.8]
MQVYANQLQAHLQQGLQSLYLVFGDDDFLRLQALRQIRQCARERGFEERIVLQQNNEFSWQDLSASQQNLSLFASQQLIELELPNAAPGQEGAKVLQQFTQQQAADTLLILHGPKLKAEQQRSKWFKGLDAKGVFVPVYTPEKNQLPGFIQQHARGYQLQLQNEAVQLLADWYEGNLMALDQALHKLALVHADAVIDTQMVQQSAMEQSRFDIFSLQDALLKGQLDAFIHRLQRLMETDAEPAIIHWLLQRECQTLHQAYTQSQQGTPLATVLQKSGVWKSQHGSYQRLLKDWSLQQSERLQQLLWRTELALKRDSGEDLTTLFSHIGLQLLDPQAAASLDFTEHTNDFIQ